MEYWSNGQRKGNTEEMEERGFQQAATTTPTLQYSITPAGHFSLPGSWPIPPDHLMTKRL
jgi:hypothetical protein